MQILATSVIIYRLHAHAWEKKLQKKKKMKINLHADIRMRKRKRKNPQINCERKKKLGKEIGKCEIKKKVIIKI